MAKLERRVQDLEKDLNRHGPVDDSEAPRRYAEALRQVGHEPPPILNGQTGREYLQSVSTEGIKALLEAKP